MAEEDIYGNKKRYERYVGRLEILKEIPNGELGGVKEDITAKIQKIQSILINSIKYLKPKFDTLGVRHQNLGIRG